MDYILNEVVGRMPEAATPWSITENEGPVTASRVDGPMGEPEGRAMEGRYTPSPSDSMLRNPRRGSILVMELLQRVPADDKFDVVDFL